MGDEQAVRELLTVYGYNPDASFEDVVTAFYRHFYPESFSHWEDRFPAPDVAAISRLLALVRAKNAA